MNRIKTPSYGIYIFLKEMDDKQAVMVLGSPIRQDIGIEMLNKRYL